MDFRIIKAKPDHSQIKDLITVLESYMKDPVGGPASFTQEMQSRLKNDLMTMSHLILFLGYSGKQIAGAAVCFSVYSTFLARTAVNIHDLAVLPEFRNKRLGTLLLLAVEDYCRSEHAGRITLEVRRDNHIARHLYLSAGFNRCNPPMDFWVKQLPG